MASLASSMASTSYASTITCKQYRTMRAQHVSRGRLCSCMASNAGQGEQARSPQSNRRQAVMLVASALLSNAASARAIDMRALEEYMPGAAPGAPAELPAGGGSLRLHLGACRRMHSSRQHAAGWHPSPGSPRGKGAHTACDRGASAHAQAASHRATLVHSRCCLPPLRCLSPWHTPHACCMTTSLSQDHGQLGHQAEGQPGGRGGWCSGV